jgi:hypothetical protein
MRASAHSAIIGPNDSGVRVSRTAVSSAGGASHESTPAPVQCTQRTLASVTADGGRRNPTYTSAHARSAGVTAV